MALLFSSTRLTPVLTVPYQKICIPCGKDTIQLNDFRKHRTINHKKTSQDFGIHASATIVSSRYLLWKLIQIVMTTRYKTCNAEPKGNDN